MKRRVEVLLGDGGSVAAQPLFEDNQTEENLMVVLLADEVALQKLPDHRGLKVTIDQRLIVSQVAFDASLQGLPEPTVHYVDGKPALFPPHDPRREESPTNPPVQPFPDAAAYLERTTKSLDVFDKFPVEKRYPGLQRVRHGKLVAVHQKFVRQRRT